MSETAAVPQDIDAPPPSHTAPNQVGTEHKINAMTEEQRQRLEERRQREAGRDAVLSESQANVNPDLSESVRGRDLVDEIMKMGAQLRQQFFFNLVIFISLTIATIYRAASAKEHKCAFHIYLFAIVNLVAYLISAVMGYLFMKNISISNYKTIKYVNLINFVIPLIMTIWGGIIKWGLCPDMIELKKNENGQPLEEDHLDELISAMVFVRLIPYSFVAFSCFCFGFFFCIALMNQQSLVNQRNQERLSRIPGAKNFIRSNARSFRISKSDLDKMRAEQKEACVICLEEFQDGDSAANGKEVIDLPCKHLLHVKCLNQWLEKNDICPICREPIPQK